MTYLGSPWRSMFLRSPKFGHELAGRSDFVPLVDLATVKLGLKTGSDGFFFVEPVGTPPSHTLLSGSTRRVRVRGLDGWEGDIQSRDLKPAVLNPHQLFRSEAERMLVVPTRATHLYVYPRDQAPAADLGSYIAVAEHVGTHERELVRTNAGSTRWYRQSRALVAGRWLLPYNSAYDYGAWDNRVGAVINGRFLGVDPRDGIDDELVGAVLNSTFVIMTRLLVGVATGVEAAYDVGPPAARTMAVPDVRLMGATGAQRVSDALAALRASDTMPASPDDRGVVAPTRRQLDEAVLAALGLSAGNAAVLIDHTYRAYARWRKSVRETQQQMEVNRSAMHRAGISRSIDPLRRIARQIWEELAPEVHHFPASALGEADQLETVDVDMQWRPGPQEPMIDPGHASDAGGVSIDLGSWARVQYAGMLLDLGFRPPLSVPTSEARASQIVEAFTNERRGFVLDVRRLASQYAGAEAEAVIEQVDRRFRQACRAGGMTPPTS